MSVIDAKVKSGVHFSNFITLENGDVEADIEIDESFRADLFDKRGWKAGDEKDEAAFNQYVNYCFQMMLHNMKERKSEAQDGE